MRSICAVLISLFVLTPLHAKEAAVESSSEQANTPARRLLTRAYELAENADSAEDFTSSLQLCKDAKKQTTDEAEIKYIRTLASWLYNKRGEWYADKAEEPGYLTEEQALQHAKKALADFQSAIKLNPNDWEARHNRGVSKATFGDFDEAIKEFGFAVKLNPKYQNGWFNRAELYYQLGNYTEAESDYSKAVELDPKDAVAITGRGHARYHLEKFEEALQDYNLSIRLQPESAEAYADRADLYAHMQRWESAARDYRVALSLDKQLARAYKNVAWLMATCPDDRFRNPGMAIKAATKAIELAGSDDYRYLEVLSAAQAANGQKTVAGQTLQQAIAIAPEGAAKQLKVQLAKFTTHE